jgi:hypothetical protein
LGTSMWLGYHSQRWVVARVARTTVLLFKKFSLRWVLHYLDDPHNAKRVTLHRPFDNSQKRSKEWICLGYNRQRITIYFDYLHQLVSVLSRRWDFRTNQTTNWHGKVRDFGHLVGQRNPQFARCAQRHSI